MNGKSGETLNRGPADVEVISAGPAEPKPRPDKPVSIALRIAHADLLELKKAHANLALEINSLETRIKELQEQVEK